MKRALALTMAVALSGCATTQPSQRQSATPPVDDGIPLSVLPQQKLDPGQCALFIWKADGDSRLVLMARTTPQVARISLGGRQADLTRMNPPADPAAGAMFDNAIYSDGSTKVTLSVTLEQRSTLQGGAVVTGGTLQLDMAGGESFIMPAAGLLACR